MLPIVIIKY